jgi:hypothetical protein
VFIKGGAKADPRALDRHHRADHGHQRATNERPQPGERLPPQPNDDREPLVRIARPLMSMMDALMTVAVPLATIARISADDR